MSTETEKTKELINKFMPHVYCYSGSGMLSNDYNENVAIRNAKECALIHCKEILFILEQLPKDKGVELANYYSKIAKELLKTN